MHIIMNQLYVIRNVSTESASVLEYAHVIVGTKDIVVRPVSIIFYMTI